MAVVGKQRESIWNPILKFSNVKKYESTRFYGGLKTFNFWYNGSQTMMYGEEFQLIFSCQFDFTHFPIDENECRMMFGDESYGVELGIVVI